MYEDEAGQWPSLRGQFLMHGHTSSRMAPVLKESDSRETSCVRNGSLGYAYPGNLAMQALLACVCASAAFVALAIPLQFVRNPGAGLLVGVPPKILRFPQEVCFPPCRS